MNRIMMLFFGTLVVTFTIASVFAHAGEDHGMTSAEGPQVTIQGELIDTACFVASEGDAKGADHAECAQACMASGIPAAILPEGKNANEMMFLLTNPAVLSPYAAQTIKVEGTPHPDMHAIDVQKIYVQEGTNWKEVELKDEHHNMMKGDEHHEHQGHKDHDNHGDKKPSDGDAHQGDQHKPEEKHDAHQH